MSSSANESALSVPRLIARVRARADVLVLGALLCAGAVVYYVAGRRMSFWYDEWSFILTRQGNSAAAFLGSHNGHFVVVPVLIYKALWATVGLGHYRPYQLVVLALHLTCVFLLFVFVRRRVGGAVAVVAASSLLFLGSAWMDIIWPFQIGYLGSIAAGLGALLVLERHDRRGDIAAALLLGLSLACSGLGIPFLAGAGIYLLLERRSWPRLWLIALPAIPYAAWYLHYGQNEASASNVSAVPSYVFDSLAGAMGALSGLGFERGKILAGLALAAIVLVVVWRRLWLQALPFIAIALAFWVLTALSRAQIHEPANSRYLYPGVLMVFLVAAELARGLRLRPAAIIVLAALVATASMYNLEKLRDNANRLRTTDTIVAAELTAVELERAIVPASFRPDKGRAPQIKAGPYLAAVRKFGSPALPESAIARQAPQVRAEFDRVLAALETPRFVLHRTAPAAGTAPRVEAFEGGTLVGHGSCLLFDPHPGGQLPRFDVVFPQGGLTVRSTRTVDVRLRRLADAYWWKPSMVLKPGLTLLRPPLDTVPEPWHVQLAPSGKTTVCSVR